MKTAEEINSMIYEIKEGISETQTEMKTYRQECRQSGDEIDSSLIEYYKEQIANSRGQLWMLEWVLS